MNVYIGGPTSQQVTNYVPQMTADTQDGYTATCSTQLNSDFSAWNAFYVSTQGGSPTYGFHSNAIGSGNRGWSQIQLPKGIIVNKIEIGARKNESSINLRPIGAFSLKGSNDGSTWTEIKAVSGLGSSWSIGSVQSWNITGQTTAYTYLKLDVQAYSTYVSFDYWNIDGVVEEVPVLKNAYIGEYVQYITTAGAYHNADLGLISVSSDGTTWITISDKNLGASTAGITSSSYGNYYQRGNCYGFPNSGNISTSNSTINVSSYGPNNYYSGSTFYGNYGSNWMNPNNNDLWGDTTNTDIARRGPCDEGYHIASSSQWLSLINILLGWGFSTPAQVTSALLLPKAGFRTYYGGGLDQQGNMGLYWSSSSNGSYKGYFFQLGASTIDYGELTDGDYKVYGMCIRPFKNEAVQPTTDWTVLYQPS